MLEYPFWGGLTSCGNIQRHGFPLSSETMSSLVPQREKKPSRSRNISMGIPTRKKKHVRCFETCVNILWKRIYFLFFPPLLISSHFFSAFFGLEDFNFKVSSFHIGSFFHWWSRSTSTSSHNKSRPTAQAQGFNQRYISPLEKSTQPQIQSK